MELIQRVKNTLRERKERVLSGKVNCIPSPFKAFRHDFPGTEKGTYYLISGAAKSSKSKLTNYMFVFNNILFAYNNPDVVRLRIFYALLEEKKERITMKFMIYLLYILNGIRIDIKTLESVDPDRIVDDKILELFDTLQYSAILDFFENHITFVSGRRPTEIWETVDKYAVKHGTVYKKKNENTLKEEFDYYIPDDPDEYVELVVDHVGKLENEKGLDDRATINKLSEYAMILRNKYDYIPVIVQQQNDKTISLDAIKNDRIRPTQSGLLMSQETARDCDMMLGITSPFSFGKDDYLKYDITKLRDNCRFLEVVLGRDGESNSMLPLYFDGATNYYAPLPNAGNVMELDKVYRLIERNEQSNSN